MLDLKILKTLNQSIQSEPYRPLSDRYLLSKGHVVRPLSANITGRIKLNGVLWKARLPKTAAGTTLPTDTEVSILYRDQLTLVVQPQRLVPEKQSLN